MDRDRYLVRIGEPGTWKPTTETLRRLHRSHLYAVPFENLDIPLGRRIDLDLPTLYEKIVIRGRGGFCYELNALFGWLLREIGFQVETLSGRVYSSDGLGPEFDHMLLLVGLSDRMLADVGFGDSFVDPIFLDRENHDVSGRRYRVVEEQDRRVLEQRNPDSDWEPQYAFTLTPRQLTDFHDMCDFQQTSPGSVFTTKSVCSLATPDGRVTLSNDRLIITQDGHRKETEIEDAEMYRALLDRHFDVKLGRDADIDAVMRRGERKGTRP